MILVTTAGKVGTAAAEVLARADLPVRVLARNPDRAAGLAALGAEVVRADLDDPATLDRALDGVASVVLVSPAVPTQELAVVERARGAGVRHVVKITSKASADSPIARRRGQAEIEAGLIASGLDYTLLRNNVYQQNFLQLAPMIAGSDRFGSSTGDGRLGLVDARDVGEVAARIAAEPAGHAGRTYWLTGPDRLSYADAAAVMTEVLGRTVTYVPLTEEQQRQAMVDAGVPAAIAAMNAQALRLAAEGDSDWVTDDVPDLLHRPARSFAQFVADHADAFSGPAS